ncbi:MAG: DUF4307 domain-containing protein [Actinomycetota bacterium]|nr:DUF4307 domain-containing protein [Actinomycetota bacterium]
MSSPFPPDRLSPEMRARYGLDQRRVSPIAVAIVVVILFLAGVAFAGIMAVRDNVEFQLIRWSVVGPDRADATFDVSRSGGDEVVCILRAQDSKRIDVGYAEIIIPPGEDMVTIDYSLRTVAPAYAVEVLACERPGELRVPGPQFPPGIAVPEQPWTPA